MKNCALLQVNKQQFFSSASFTFSTRRQCCAGNKSFTRRGVQMLPWWS